MKLNQKEAQILANGYDSSFWQVFKKHFLVGKEVEINRETPFVPNWDGVQVAKGRIIQLREIDAQMNTVKKKQDKRES